MLTILITGAASGLGKSFVEAYALDPTNTIYAADNSFPSTNTNPSKIFKTHAHLTQDNINLLDLDVTDSMHVNRIPADVPFDLVIHSAGVRGLNPECEVVDPAHVARAETLETTECSVLLDTFEINAIGTFRVLRKVVDILRGARVQKGSSRESGGGTTRPLPKVVVMGSRMGSVGGNRSGGAYAYRASKAGLNAIVRSFAVDVPEVAFVVVHPGRVESGLVPVEEDGAISAEEAVRDMLPLIEKLEREDSGRFVDRFGVDIPW